MEKKTECGKTKRIKGKTIRKIAAGLFLVATAAAFSGMAGAGAEFLHVQFGPSLLSVCTAFSAGSLAALIGIAVVTFVFGRFYCAVFCPLGILQDVAAFVFRRRTAFEKNAAPVRYVVAGVVYGMLIAGWSVGFFLLDPYSITGRIAVSFSIGALAPFLIVLALGVWRRRFYCVALCPVGTLLGLIAGHGVYRLRITGKCVHCGKCVGECPAGCIDLEAGTIDNERCVRCMNCVSSCPLHGIHLVRPEKRAMAFDASRRAFLRGGGALLVGLAGGFALAKAGMGKLAAFAGRFRILPPGAGNAERFAARCTGCQLCTANCPAKIIRPAEYGAGPVSLDLSKGACRFDCHRCSQVCPTGAIRPLSLEEKRKTRIAEAQFLPKNCIVFQEGTPCGRCAKACPTRAVTLRRTGAPKLNASLCIGCGACQLVCPAPEKAMVIREVEEQTLLPS